MNRLALLITGMFCLSSMANFNEILVGTTRFQVPSSVSQGIVTGSTKNLSGLGYAAGHSFVLNLITMLSGTDSLPKGTKLTLSGSSNTSVTEFDNSHGLGITAQGGNSFGASVSGSCTSNMGSYLAYYTTSTGTVPTNRKISDFTVSSSQFMSGTFSGSVACNHGSPFPGTFVCCVIANNDNHANCSDVSNNYFGNRGSGTPTVDCVASGGNGHTTING